MKLEGRMDERNRAVNGWTEEKETRGVEGFTNVGNKLAEERTDPNLALGCPSFSGCSIFHISAGRSYARLRVERKPFYAWII